MYRMTKKPGEMVGSTQPARKGRKRKRKAMKRLRFFQVETADEN